MSVPVNKLSNSLNLQSLLWKESLDYTLHSRIDIPNDSLRVADIGCGTGAWLLQLHDDLKRADVELDGFDTNLQQSPPEAWLPQSIRIQQWNAFEEPPVEMLERYDVVHVRLFMINIVNDASPIIENVRKILKPGGWLQWEEVNNRDNEIVKVSSHCKQEALEKCVQYIERSSIKHVGMHKWITELPETLMRSGFENVSRERHQDPLYLAKYFFETWLQTFSEWTRLNLKDTEEGRENMEMIGDAWTESLDGAAIRIGKQICIAQKSCKI